MGSLTDIEKLQRELEEVNRKLLGAEKVKSDFLSNIKNEINNPLTSILGLLRVATKHPEDHQGNADIIAMVYKEVYSLNFQMRNILTAAEIEAGQALINLSRFNLKELVEQVVESHVDINKQLVKGIEVKVNEEEYFASDREKLSIILSNLISNALKFSKEEPQVIISSQYDDQGNLQISVTDFGVGISTTDMNLVYDRFKQLDSGTKKEFGGHGLGLAIVHALVGMLNGTFELETKEGSGSTFTVTVPPINENQKESVFYDDDEGILFGQDEGEEEVF